ncbi:MAG: FAD:protein FMN transferase [Eubacteriales bacterium]
MKKLRQKAMLAVSVIILATVISGCNATEKKQEKQIFAMDTVMTLTAYGENAKEALDESIIQINQLESLLSATKEGSDIYNINNNAGEYVEVSDDTLEQIRASMQTSQRTVGEYDISVYPLVKLWGFDTKDYKVPDAKEISAATKNVNYENIEISGNSVKIQKGMAIDLGSIAKGYTSEKIIELFLSLGVKSAIISLGGNVQVLGTKPDGEDWKIGIQDPLLSDGILGTLSVSDTAVVTSGGYQRYFEEDGKTYHHIIDPSTGYPSDSGLLSVTIVCSNGMMADELSTALFVLGLDGAVDYWKTYGGFEAVFVTDENKIYVTSGLKDIFNPYSTQTNYTYEFIEN